MRTILINANTNTNFPFKLWWSMATTVDEALATAGVLLQVLLHSRQAARLSSIPCDTVAVSTIYRPSSQMHWTWQATTGGHCLWTSWWRLAIIREQSITFTNLLLCVIALHNKVSLLLEATSNCQVKQRLQKPLTPPTWLWNILLS